MEIIKKYLPLKQNDAGCTHLKVKLYYHLGGFNMFTYMNEARGYYLSVVPVKRWNSNGCMMESFTAFTGRKQLVLEVARKSSAKEKSAVQMEPELEPALVSCILHENNLELEEDA